MVARAPEDIYTVTEEATGRIVGTVPADLIDKAKENARANVDRMKAFAEAITSEGFMRDIIRELAKRPRVEGLPAPDATFEQVHLPVPDGATFTDGQPIRTATCLALSTQWFTQRRSEGKQWNGEDTEPVAVRPDDPETGDPCPWIMVILPEDVTAAQAAYITLLWAVQARPGTYLESGLGGFTRPCTVWRAIPTQGVKQNVFTGGTDDAK